MKIKKTLATILLFCAAQAQADTIRFGVDPTYPPFSYKNKSGELEGFEIEIGNALCAKLQSKCVWVVNEFDGLVAGLKAKKFDGILSSMQPTAERLKQIDFTDGLYSVYTALVASKGSPLSFNEASLRGKSIGVEQGTVQDLYANKNLAAWGVTVVSYQSQDQVYADLINGRLNGSLQDVTQAELGFLSTPQGKDFKVSDVLRDPATQADIAIGVSKSNTDLKEKLNGAIKGIRDSGEFEKIEEKYFSNKLSKG